MDVWKEGGWLAWVTRLVDGALFKRKGGGAFGVVRGKAGYLSFEDARL